MTKQRLEREAIQLFLKHYNETADNPLRLLYQQEKPDAVLMDRSGRKLGVEITHLFYNEVEARQLFQQNHRSFVCIESFQHLLQALNQQLVRKEAKSAGYSREYPLALLIRNLSPHFGWSDFNEAWDQITFVSQAFTYIWFLAKNNVSGGEDEERWYLKRLWPHEYGHI